MSVILILISMLLVSIPQGTTQEIDREKMTRKVNALREAGCICGRKKMSPAPPLRWNETLEESAYKHAKDMQKRNYFSHVSPNGKNPGDRVKMSGYDWSYVGENIASGQKTFEEVLDRWINSPVHCKILMNPNFDEMAVARYEDKWVQHFGRKRE